MSPRHPDTGHPSSPPPVPRMRAGAGRPGSDRARCISPLVVALACVLVITTVLGRPAYGQNANNLNEDLAIEQWSFGPIGTIAAPHGAGVQLTDVSTGAEQLLAVMPPVGVSGHASWSPDRTRLAISRFGRRPTERVGGSDILVVPAVGGEALPIAEHDLDGALLGAPVWLPDSSGLFYDSLPPSGDPASSHVMFAPVGAANTGRTIAAGGWPAVSSDGRYLAYVRPSPTTGYLNELVIVDMAQSAERILVAADELVQITSPRFSPDGTEIAFAGSVSYGEAMEMSSPHGLTDLFMKGVMAHGPPGDVWVISLYGGAPQRLTTFDEDEPTLAWSPDGYWLAMMGGGGLYLLPRDLSQTPRKIAKGGFGGIDWR
jgi:Tol biopolymer transport system component